jgi:hypothetical protein
LENKRVLLCGVEYINWLQFVCQMTALEVVSRKPKYSFRVRSGWGLRRMMPGTLNGSSPTANLVGVNIKGKWIVFHFPCGTWTKFYLVVK